jgi:hypothetical protein
VAAGWRFASTAWRLAGAAGDAKMSGQGFGDTAAAVQALSRHTV